MAYFRHDKIEPIINYILELMLGNDLVASQIEYGKQPSGHAKITIIASYFFDEDVYLTEKSMPVLPLPEWNGTPILFGKPKDEMVDGRLIIYADIIASTYFLMSRYEECLNRSARDSHGRFLGEWSILGRMGYLERPIIDEYGKILRKSLRKIGYEIGEPREGYSHIYLTHDVDEIWQWDNFYRACRTFTKRLLLRKSNKMESFLALLNYKKWDGIYTFPFFEEKYLELQKQLSEDMVSEVYFMKGGGVAPCDNGYYHNRKRTKELADYIKGYGAIIGLHSSYSAGEKPKLVQEEKEYLEALISESVLWQRNHYLDSREPEDMESLILAGITNDFTMGYADRVGFRIGTSHPVRWINPKTMELTSLVLHPMTVMEGTLDAENYMNLNYEDAYLKVKILLEQIKKHNGEVVLLWHNTSVAKDRGGYQRKLYSAILQLLANELE